MEVEVVEPTLARKLRAHAGFWTRSRGTGPLAVRSAYSGLAEIELPLAQGGSAPVGSILTPESLSPDLLAASEKPAAVTSMSVAGIPASQLKEAVTRLGDAFAVVAPFQRVPWMEAILGCKIRVGAESMWSEPWLDYPWNENEVRLRPGNPWLAKLLDITRALVRKWKPPVMVTQTLMRGPIDMMAAVLGNEQTVYALHDSPEECRRLLEICTDAFIQVAKAQRELIPSFHDGHCSWFGVWAPGSVVRTQCDASALIGPQWYESYVLPFDLAICRAFDYSVIHLHSGFLGTVEGLLNEDVPTAIQVAIDPGAFGPPPLELLPAFRRIMERKPLLIEGRLTQRELDVLLSELPPDGLFIGAALAEEGAPIS